MKRKSNLVPLLVFLFLAANWDTARCAEVMRLPLKLLMPGPDQSFFLDGQGMFWLSSPTGILCFDSSGTLRKKIVAVNSAFVVGDSSVFVFSRPAVNLPKGPLEEVAPDPHVDIYRREKPELKWVNSLWEPRQTIHEMVWSPMRVDRDGLIWFSGHDRAVCVNERLEVIKDQPRKCFMQGDSGLFFEIELITNTQVLPWKQDHWELRIYDQAEKLINVEKDKNGFGLVCNCYGEVEFVECGGELRKYDKSGVRTRTIRIPSHSGSDRIGPDGNYYYGSTKGDEFVISKFAINKH